jgi:hypothetical protein
MALLTSAPPLPKSARGLPARIQPQGISRVNTNNSLTTGLIFATANPLGAIAATGQVQTKTGNLIATGVPQGLGVSAPDGTGIVSLPLNVHSQIVGKDFTVAWVMDGVRSSGNPQAVYCCRDASTQNFVIGISDLGFNIVNGGGTSVGNGMPASLMTATRFAVTNNKTQGLLTMYADSSSATSSSISPASSSIIPSILNRQSGGRGMLSSVSLVAIWNRSLSTAEYLSWKDNPWQIFIDENTMDITFMQKVLNSLRKARSMFFMV